MPFPISREIEYFDIQWEHLKRICSPDPTDPPPPPVDPDPPTPPEPPPAEPESVKHCLERERKRLGPGSEFSSRRRPYGTKPN